MSSRPRPRRAGLFAAARAAAAALTSVRWRRTLNPMCPGARRRQHRDRRRRVGVASTSRAAGHLRRRSPPNRFIDGFPAYAQCAGSMTGAVYSNNGIDTSTTSGGAGWVRTQRSGGYQCTELAHRYLTFKWNIQSVPNGDAGVWCDAALPAGLVKATTPVHGDPIVLGPGFVRRRRHDGACRRHRPRQCRFVGHGGATEHGEPFQIQRAAAPPVSSTSPRHGRPQRRRRPRHRRGRRGWHGHRRGRRRWQGRRRWHGRREWRDRRHRRGWRDRDCRSPGGAGTGGTIAPTPDGAAGMTGVGPGGAAGTTGGSPGASPDGASGGCAYGARSPSEGLAPFSLFVLVAFATRRRRRQ